MPLGIEGFTYADLYRPPASATSTTSSAGRLAESIRRSGREWDAYRADPTRRASPLGVSDLIVRMAPHVSRFVGAPVPASRRAAGDLRRATHELDPLFRFKVDFVRKRALPLVKGGAHVHARSGRRGRGRARWSRPFAHLDRERGDRQPPAARCSTARRRLREAGVGRRQGGASPPQIDALKRWCARACTIRRTASWVIFRFPGDARLPEPGAGPAAARRAARGDDRARRPCCAAATASS